MKYSEIMECGEIASILVNSWTNGCRNAVIGKLSELDPITAAAVSARMVLLLHNGHDLPTDLALFTSRLDLEASKI